MRIKTLALGLVCLFLATCKSPTSPDVSEIIEQEEQLNLPTIEFFTANPSSLWYLENSTLSWKVINANTVEIDNGIGEIPKEGYKEISPIETTIYILTATNDDGNVKQSCKISCRSAYLWVWPGDFGIALGDYEIHAYGKVRNRGWTIAYNPRVIVNIRSSSGELLTSKEQELCEKLEPGQEISWNVIFNDPENYLRNNFSSQYSNCIYEWDE